jgi:hypothetical protein
MLVKHDEIIALRLIEGEEIDGDGTLVMAREPLTVFGLVGAKMCPRCCRGKRTSHLHFPTGVVTRGLPAQEIAVPNTNATFSLSAVPLHKRARVVTMNPIGHHGIAMQALSRTVRASVSSGDGSGGSTAAAARSGGGVSSAAAKVNAPPRDDSVTVEGGGGGGAAAAHSGGESARFVSLARGSDAAAAAHGGGEQSDTMHFNRMAFGRLSAGEGEGGAASIDIREEGDDAARPRDGLPDDDGAAARSGEEEEEEEEEYMDLNIPMYRGVGVS